MRPRHALAAAAILTAVTLGSWAALTTDSPRPAPQAADPQAAPVTASPDTPADSSGPSMSRAIDGSARNPINRFVNVIPTCAADN